MKHIIKFLIISIGILFSSCATDDLIESPEYLINENEIFTSEEGAELAIQGALSTLENEFWSYQGYHTLMSPSGGFLHRIGGGQTVELNNFNFKDNQTFPQLVWNVNYKVIYALNAIINNFEENFPDYDSLSPRYKNVLGKAYFLRGYQYFKLVRMWGEIPMPLVASSGATNNPLSSEEEVYATIVNDFEFAKSLLPERIGAAKYTGLINTAANAFLAKVYATQAGWLNQPQYWELAKKHADTVITSGNYRLLDDLTVLHSADGRNSEEAIFELQQNGLNLNSLGQAYTPVGLETTLWGGFIKVQPWMWTQQVSDPLYSDFTKQGPIIKSVRDHDPRIDISYIDSTYTRTNGVVSRLYPLSKWASGAYLHIAKYLDPGRTNNASIRNWKILRYADILLLRAEIENEINGPAQAYQYVNQVLSRARSNGTSVYPKDWDASSVSDKDSFRKKIAWERMYELIGEGHEFFEARRRGRDFLVNDFFIPIHNNFSDPVLAASIRTKQTSEDIMHFKIPAGEASQNTSID